MMTDDEGLDDMMTDDDICHTRLLRQVEFDDPAPGIPVTWRDGRTSCCHNPPIPHPHKRVSKDFFPTKLLSKELKTPFLSFPAVYGIKIPNPTKH